MTMSNQKRVDRIVRDQKCLYQRKGEFLDWISRHCEREGIPKRKASISKTTRGNSNVDTRGWERRLREAERS